MKKRIQGSGRVTFSSCIKSIKGQSEGGPKSIDIQWLMVTLPNTLLQLNQPRRIDRFGEAPLQHLHLLTHRGQYIIATNKSQLQSNLRFSSVNRYFAGKRQWKGQRSEINKKERKRRWRWRREKKGWREGEREKQIPFQKFPKGKPRSRRWPVMNYQHTGCAYREGSAKRGPNTKPNQFERIYLGALDLGNGGGREGGKRTVD